MYDHFGMKPEESQSIYHPFPKHRLLAILPHQFCRYNNEQEHLLECIFRYHENDTLGGKFRVKLDSCKQWRSIHPGCWKHYICNVVFLIKAIQLAHQQVIDRHPRSRC